MQLSGDEQRLLFVGAWYLANYTLYIYIYAWCLAISFYTDWLHHICRLVSHVLCLPFNTVLRYNVVAQLKYAME